MPLSSRFMLLLQMTLVTMLFAPTSIPSSNPGAMSKEHAGHIGMNRPAPQLTTLCSAAAFASCCHITALRVSSLWLAGVRGATCKHDLPQALH